MATIVDLKKSFMDMSFEEQYKLIEAVQLSRLTPKKIIKARTSKSKKKQLSFKELLAEVKLMHPDDKKRFMEENGLI